MLDTEGNPVRSIRKTILELASLAIGSVYKAVPEP
jgi:hypothetical protein